MTKNEYFSLLTHTKQLLLVTFCNTLAGIEIRFGRTEPDGRTEPRTDGQTDVEVEIVTVPAPLNGALDQWPPP